MLPSWRPKLYSITGSRIRLTNIARLFLAQSAIAGGGVRVESLAHFAENDFERLVIGLIAQAQPEIFDEIDDPIKALVVLKVVLVPMVCRGLIRENTKKSRSSSIWFGWVAAHALAFERTMLECIARQRNREPRIRGVPRTDPERSKMERELNEWFEKFSMRPITDWFDDAKEQYLFWLHRFRQWQFYAWRSWCYYISRQSIDVRFLEGSLKDAAVCGVLRNLSRPPQGWCAEVFRRLESDWEREWIFTKTARKMKTRPSNVKLKSWLIEVWPLVLEYGWNYADVRTVANLSFEKRALTILVKTKGLKKVCRNLGLHLAPAGQGKKSRTKYAANDSEPVQPILFELAWFIKGIGTKPLSWAIGQAHTAKRPGARVRPGSTIASRAKISEVRKGLGMTEGMVRNQEPFSKPGSTTAMH
jgi:hypothetical protein